MANKRITVFAPATISNVGPGFDVLGLAIENLGDIVIASRTKQLGLRFSLKTDNGTIPNDKNNIAAYVAQLMIDSLELDFGIDLTLQKNMPIGSGLGSSGASAAAAAFAVNALQDNPLSKHDIIHFAAQGEQLATGSAHADNVAPSLLGGLCLIRSYSPLDVIQLPCAMHLHWIVAHPNMQIATKEARALLPKTVAISDAIAQSGNLAALLHGLQVGDNKIIAASLHDNFAEPVRSKLIPGFQDIKAAALSNGALGFSISGSGPSVFAVTENKNNALKIGMAIKDAFQQYSKLHADIYISSINTQGAYIMEENA